MTQPSTHSGSNGIHMANFVHVPGKKESSKHTHGLSSLPSFSALQPCQDTADIQPVLPAPATTQPQAGHTPRSEPRGM